MTQEYPLAVAFAGLVQEKNSFLDLSIPEVWAGLSLTPSQISAKGGFVRAAVLEAAKRDQETKLYVKNPDSARGYSPVYVR